MTRRRVGAMALFVIAFAVALLPGAGGAYPASTLSRLLPPPDGQSYFGFTLRLWDTTDPAWGDTRPFSERAADAVQIDLGKKKPTLLTVWAGWQAADEPGKPLVPFSSLLPDVRKVESVVGDAGFVALDWTLTSTSPTNGGITTKDVAAGSLDAYIRQYAQEVKAYGRPVLIRLFGGEFNGSWWHGVSPRANPSLTTGDFVAAWRRVVDLFRATGAANASWAWVPNAVPPEPVLWVDSDIGSYYPGDDYVDWAGGDAYDVGPPSWLDRLYAFAVEHGKPFDLAEWGVRHDGSTLTPVRQREWIEAMFDYVEARPAIKAISYFNYNNRVGGSVPIDPARTVTLYGGSVNYQANVNDHDHRLLADSGAGFRTTFAKRIAAPRFVSAANTAGVAARQKAVAVVTAVTVSGRVATVRWRGSVGAQSYDLAVRRGTAAWKLIGSRLTSTSYRLRGAPRTTVQVRVRVRDASGAPGPWSSARTVRFR